MTSCIRGSALLGFGEFAGAQGLDPHALLTEVSLAAVNPEAMIDTGQFNELLKVCAQRSGNPLFGLQFGLQHGLRGLGSLLPVIQNTSTVGEVLNALGRYSHLHCNAAEFRLERHARHARLLFQVTDADIPCVRQTVDWAIGMTAQLMHSLLKHSWHPHGLLLRHTTADLDPGAYRNLLGVMPRLASLENAWVFAPSLLDTRLAAKDERIMQLMRQLHEELTDITLQALPDYVQKLMRRRMPHGHVTLEQIASDLNFSPRSLQRYLQNEGTSFQMLLDQTRQAVAARFIRDSSVSLTQLAHLLGYTQLGAFSRAFSRWYGINPQQWKRQLPREQVPEPPSAGRKAQRPGALRPCAES